MRLGVGPPGAVVAGRLGQRGAHDGAYLVEAHLVLFAVFRETSQVLVQRSVAAAGRKGGHGAARRAPPATPGAAFLYERAARHPGAYDAVEVANALLGDQDEYFS